MSPDVPDRPLSFDRLQQQLILTEVELMKLEDLRDELTTRAESSDRVLLSLQLVTDQACAERDHLSRRAAELDATVQRTLEQLAASQARNKELNATASGLMTAHTHQQERIRQLSDSLAAMQSSLTWRLTAPLRALGRFFRRRA